MSVVFPFLSFPGFPLFFFLWGNHNGRCNHNGIDLTFSSNVFVVFVFGMRFSVLECVFKNSFAPIVRSEQSQVTVDSVLNIKGFDLTRTLEMDPEFLDTDAEHIHDKTIGSMSINVDGDVHMMLINSFIGGILQTLGNDIYRMKGVLAISGSPEKFVYQGVHMLFDGEFHGNWEEGEKRCSKLVFIGKNLDKDKLQKDFEKCLNVPANNERIAAIESIKLQERIGGQLLGAAQRDDSRAVTSLIAMGADVNFGNVVRGTGCFGGSDVLRRRLSF